MSIPFGADIPFVHHLGFTLEKFEGGESELRYAPRLQRSKGPRVLRADAAVPWSSLERALLTAREAGFVEVSTSTATTMTKGEPGHEREYPLFLLVARAPA